MALEAVVFPQQDLLGYNGKEFFSLAGGAEAWSYGFAGVEEEEMVVGSRGGCGGGGERRVEGGVRGSNWDSSCSSVVQNMEELDVNSSSPETCTAKEGGGVASTDTPEAVEAEGGRKKRRCMRSSKNKEEVENQRMTHIAVERNRRKQMNEYLAVLRSLMPPSHAQRGDQASIIGGVINFVKELEQLLQSLEAKKRMKQLETDTSSGSSTPFTRFFAFPQYSTYSAQTMNASAAATASTSADSTAKNRSAVANIEVTMAESHANLKILSRRQPKLLLKMLFGLHNLRLTTLHLNVTTVEQLALYSFSVKVEEDCRHTSVDEIATAVHEMLGRIQDETGFN